MTVSKLEPEELEELEHEDEYVRLEYPHLGRQKLN
jgi:hypothetical protein